MTEATVLTHQEIGIQQKLFFQDDSSPGSIFWLPAGAHIYHKLQELLRTKYRERDYQEVITPNIGHSSLWKTSGHWDKYRANMFVFGIKEDVESTDDAHLYAMKAMNCPLHCRIFKHMTPSYRDMPVKLADFGALHRNEASGALSGLTRVRRFVCDDAHLYCRMEDISSQIQDALKFMSEVYSLFNLEFEMELSTRPDEYIGDLEKWNMAEEMLKTELNNFGHKWSIDEKGGAFYGPKIDIKVKDSLNRMHQCATIQLDFNLPDRFDLSYQTNDPDNQYERPVIIHRAIYGSFERFISILCEHTQGYFPFWLSPRQIKVVPISSSNFDYAQMVRDELWKMGYQANVDVGDLHFKNKIKDGEVLKYNYTLVVGNKEQGSKSVNVRAGGNQTLMTLDAFKNVIAAQNLI